MKDFASYTGGEKKDNEGEIDFAKEAEKLSRGYEGARESDMMKAIYEKAVEGKRAGTLTNEQIDAFVKQFAPMLNGVQRKKLQKIVAELKKI